MQSQSHIMIMWNAIYYAVTYIFIDFFLMSSGMVGKSWGLVRMFYTTTYIVVIVHIQLTFQLVNMYCFSHSLETFVLCLSHCIVLNVFMHFIC